MSESTILTRILNVNAYVPALIGLTSVIVGFILFYLVENETAGTLYVTVGIGFFAWALAIKSETIINETKDLVTKTNQSIDKTNEQIEETKELIKTIGIGSVVDGIGYINDWRLTLRDKFSKIKLLQHPINRVIVQDYINQHSFTIWKTLTFINKIFYFEKHLIKKEAKRLIHEIDCLFFDLIDGKIFFRITIDDNYKKQLQQIYNKIAGLDVFKEKPKRVTRMRNNLKFLKGEINYFMNWDNEKIYLNNLMKKDKKKTKLPSKK